MSGSLGDYGDVDIDGRIRAKWARFGGEYRLSRDPEAITVMEDLQEGNPKRFEYNDDRGEVAFLVLGSVGFPRKVLGTVVIVLKDNEEVVMYLE
jgi:hypothetical protein